MVVFSSYCIFVGGNRDIPVLWEEAEVDHDTCFGDGSGGVRRDDDLCRAVMDPADRFTGDPKSRAGYGGFYPSH